MILSNEAVQPLSVPKLSKGTNYEITKAVDGAVEDWGLAEHIRWMSFDTTASKTGGNTGACAQIEQQLQKNLLYFACRHHVLELLFAVTFTTVMGSTSGPNVPLFKRFQERCQLIDQSQFESGVSHPDGQPLLESQDKNWLQITLIDHKALRDDYRELLELIVIFLGQVPP